MLRKLGRPQQALGSWNHTRNWAVVFCRKIVYIFLARCCTSWLWRFMAWNVQTAWKSRAVHVAKDRQTTVQKINMHDFHESWSKQHQHEKWKQRRHGCPKNGSAFGFGCFPLARRFFAVVAPRKIAKQCWRKTQRNHWTHVQKWRKKIQICKMIVMRRAVHSNRKQLFFVLLRVVPFKGSISRQNGKKSIGFHMVQQHHGTIRNMRACDRHVSFALPTSKHQQLIDWLMAWDLLVACRKSVLDWSCRGENRCSGSLLAVGGFTLQ